MRSTRLSPSIDPARFTRPTGNSGDEYLSRSTRLTDGVDRSLPTPRDLDRDRDSAGSLRARFEDVYTNRMGPPYHREDEQSQSSYERESSRLGPLDSARPAGVPFLEAVNRAREHLRQSFPVPDVTGPAHRRGSVVDGLGDRERSLRCIYPPHLNSSRNMWS